MKVPTTVTVPVKKKPLEAEGATVIGTIGMSIIITLVVLLIYLDLPIFMRHIKKCFKTMLNMENTEEEQFAII